MNVRRHDKVVHIVERWRSWTGFENEPRVDAHGKGIDDEGRTAVLSCGRRAKLNRESPNRVTEDTPTCVECLIVDAFGTDYRKKQT